MSDRELMQMALDALEAALSNDQPYISRSKETAEALRARLAQPEHKWVGMTDEEIKSIRVACGNPLALHIEFARAIEAKLKEKNA